MMDVFDFVLAPIVVILRQHHMVQYRSQLLPIYPQEDPCLG